MGRTNVYCVYSLHTTETKIPFYVGHTKGSIVEETLGSQLNSIKVKRELLLHEIKIKNGLEVTKTEILRRVLDKVEMSQFDAVSATDKLNRKLSQAKGRIAKSYRSILQSTVFADNLHKHEAIELSNKLLTAVKIICNGCPYEDVKQFLTVDEAKQLISKYAAYLGTIEETFRGAYDDYSEKVEAEYKTIIKARERLAKHKARHTPENVPNQDDPFGAFVDDN